MLVGVRKIQWDTFLAGFGSGLGLAVVVGDPGQRVEDILYLVAIVALGLAGVLRARRRASTVEPQVPTPVPPPAP
jgi:hypothetical protein